MLKSRILRNHNGAKDRGGQTSQRTRSVWRCRVAGAQKKWRQNRAHWIWPEGAQCQFQGVQGISREHEVRMTLFWETFLWMEGKGTTPDDLGWFCCYQFVFSFRWERPKLLKIAWISSGANTQKNRKEEGAEVQAPSPGGKMDRHGWERRDKGLKWLWGTGGREGHHVDG